MKTFKITQLAFVLSLASTSLIATQTAHAHCQVPCGIYDDSARLQTMLEDAATITKATTQLAELAGKHDAQSINQSTRWVLNKEQHAQRIIATISDYYLTQRVKPSQADYTERLAKHHAVIIAAMQAKQNADGSYAAALTETIEALAAYYPLHRH
jgi:nickel superoxide dismutase